MKIKPSVVWLTGLSGSGKSTISEQLVKELQSNFVSVEHLDGDIVRGVFPQTGFSREERNLHIRRMGYIAHLLEKHGITVVCSFISPYIESRDFVRSICNNFVEVYISTPLEVCEKRDVKGLYAKVRKGEIKQFTGIDDPYEPPIQPEIVLNTENNSVAECINAILNFIKL